MMAVMNAILASIIAATIALSNGWTINGMDGMVEMSDSYGNSFLNIPAECARYIHDAGYDNTQEAVRYLSATPEYKDLCF